MCIGLTTSFGKTLIWLLRLPFGPRFLLNLPPAKPVAPPKTTYLIKEQLPSLLFPEIHLLHGNLLPRVLLGGDADNPCGALPDLDEVVQVLPGVTRADHKLQGSSELFVGHPGGLLV